MSYNAPSAASADGWIAHSRAKAKNAPMRFKLEQLVRFYRRQCMRFNEVLWWFRYRTTHRYHKIWTGLTPGYRDPRTVLLHASFQILVDFVEIEKASKHWACGGWKEVSRWGRFKNHFTKRNPVRGIDYLNWEITLIDEMPSQAEAARRILTLYNWWTKIRPTRKEIKSTHYKIREKGFLYSFSTEFKEKYPELDKELNQIHKMNWRLEGVHDMIDGIMLKQLADVRLCLWT